MSKQFRKLLVTGAPRSGTKHVAAVLRRSGMDTPHERVGADGTVSCLFCPYSTPAGRVRYSDGDGAVHHVHPNGERPADFKFGHVVHLIRHPLKAIGSIRDTLLTNYKIWAQRTLGQDMGLKKRGDLLWAMTHWLVMTDMADALDCDRVKVEEFSDYWKLLKGRFGFRKESCPDVSKTMHRSLRTVTKFKPTSEVYGSISYPTMAELTACNKSLAGRVAIKLKKYKYT